MYRKQLDEYLDAHCQAMVDAVCRIVAIKSVLDESKENAPFGEGSAACLKETLALAEELGLQTKNYDYYVGTADHGPDERALDILAHLDVVPASDKWSVTQPYVPLVKDGCIYGRGTSDNKGAAIAAMFAIKAVKDLGIPLKKGVRLLFGTDEETGFRDINYYYEREAQATYTIAPDAKFPIVNVEKGTMPFNISGSWEEENTALPRICSVSGGSAINIVPSNAAAVLEGFDAAALRTLAEKTAAETGLGFSVSEEEGKQKVFVTGLSSHGSLPQEGNNAITGLLLFLSQLETAPSCGMERLMNLYRLFPHGDWNGRSAGIAMGDDISGDLTVSFDLLEYTPSSLIASFDSRIPLCATKDNSFNVVVSAAKKIGLTATERSGRKPHYIPADSTLVSTLLKCYRDYTGDMSAPLSSGVITYVHGKENAVAFGPSMASTDYRIHGEDEFLVIDELVLSAKIYAQVIIAFCT